MQQSLRRAIWSGPVAVLRTEPPIGAAVGWPPRWATSTEFVDFLAQVVASQPLGRQIHLIADNLSAHKTKVVEDFLANHPKSAFILHPLTLPGLTKSKSGSPKSKGG